MQKDNENFLELAFHDLSPYSSVFRSRLIEEFQLLDNISTLYDAKGAPQYTTRDIKDSKQLRKILLHDPFQLIKFQPLKRQLQQEEGQKKDRRLTRTKNIDSLPIGAWAAWVVQSKLFQNGILALIFITAIFSGVSVELRTYRAEYHRLFDFINILEIVSTLIFMLEIGLKWTDNFAVFWKNGWNIFDFLLTVISAVPIIVEATYSGSSGQSYISLLNILKSFRVMRSLKVVARFGNLKIIIQTILNAFKSMSVILALCAIVAYIYAIVGINLFASYTESKDPSLTYQWSFSNLGPAMFSLFELVTFDNWAMLTADIAKVVTPSVTYIYCISWIWLGGFIFRNVFIGVIVSDFQDIHEKIMEKEAEYIKQKKFERLRKKLDKELNARDKAEKQALELKNKDKTKNIRRSSIMDIDKNISRASLVPSLGSHSLDTLPHLITPGKQYENRFLEQEWERTVGETMQGLVARSETTLWPKDTLFRYLTLIEKLQENLRENEELETLAANLLLDLTD